MHPGESQHVPYSADLLEAILAETADVLREIGFANYHVTIIGGLVPSLLIPAVEDWSQPHVGTTDIDLCMSLALAQGDTGLYERLEAVLSRLGFTSADASFRWTRVAGTRVELEFFCPTPPHLKPGSIFRPTQAESPVAKSNFGARLSALTLDAGELLVRDAEVVTRTVTLPQGKGRVDLSLRVAGPIGFLVSKADALVGRDKPKDAYDIVWLVENWPSGPRGAASDFARRPAWDAHVHKRLVTLCGLFDTTDALGAVSYARFFDETGARVNRRRQAVGAMRDFAWGLAENAPGT